MTTKTIFILQISLSWALHDYQFCYQIKSALLSIIVQWNKLHVLHTLMCKNDRSLHQSISHQCKVTPETADLWREGVHLAYTAEFTVYGQEALLFWVFGKGPNMTGSCGAKPLISNAKEGEKVRYSPQSTWGRVFQDFRDFLSILYSKQFMELKPSSTTSTVGGHNVILYTTDYRFSLQTFISGLHSSTFLTMTQYIPKLQIWFSINFFFCNLLKWLHFHGAGELPDG